MPKLNISLAQMNIELGDVQRNANTMQKMVVDAVKRGSHLVLLPELWSTGYDWDNHQAHAVELNSGMFDNVSNLAKKGKSVCLAPSTKSAGIMLRMGRRFMPIMGS